MDPGFSATDMVIHAAQTFGSPEATLVTPEEAYLGLECFYLRKPKKKKGAARWGDCVLYRGDAGLVMDLCVCNMRLIPLGIGCAGIVGSWQ